MSAAISSSTCSTVTRAGVGDWLEAREPLRMFERERVLIVKEVLTARRADENALAVIFHKNGAHVVVRTRIG